MKLMLILAVNQTELRNEQEIRRSQFVTREAAQQLNKSTACSSKIRKFKFQNPHGSSKPSVITTLEDATLYCSLRELSTHVHKALTGRLFSSMLSAVCEGIPYAAATVRIKMERMKASGSLV